MSNTYNRISTQVFTSLRNVIHRQKSSERDMNNQNLFGMINGYVELYNEAWDRYVKANHV